MASNIKETVVWETGVREVGEGEPVTGGPDGTVNLSLQDLANRTAWLKKQCDDLSAALTAFKTETGSNFTSLKGGKTGDNAIIHIAAPTTANGLRSINGSFWTDSNINAAVAPDLPGNASGADWVLLQLGMINGRQKTQIYTGGGGLWIREDDAASGSETWNQQSWVKLMRETDVEAKCREVLKAAYPVGSLYMSVNATDPRIALGFGTWEKITGRFIIGADSNTGQYKPASTGGEATHTLTASELPSHTHSATTDKRGEHTHSGTAASAGKHHHGALGEKAGYGGSNWPYGFYDNKTHMGTEGGIDYDDALFNTTTDGAHTHTVTVGKAGAHAHNITVKATGSGTAHNNIPPYFAAYIWRRTA